MFRFAKRNDHVLDEKNKITHFFWILKVLRTKIMTQNFINLSILQRFDVLRRYCDLKNLRFGCVFLQKQINLYLWLVCKRLSPPNESDKWTCRTVCRAIRWFPESLLFVRLSPQNESDKWTYRTVCSVFSAVKTIKPRSSFHDGFHLPKRFCWASLFFQKKKCFGTPFTSAKSLKTTKLRVF